MSWSPLAMAAIASSNLELIPARSRDAAVTAALIDKGRGRDGTRIRAEEFGGSSSRLSTAWIPQGAKL
jgi:hypothetical protein